MSQANPFHAFRVMTFDVVGTLIDFEGGMLTYLRQSGAAPPDVSDAAILDAYRASRTAVRRSDTPMISNAPISISCAMSVSGTARAWRESSGIPRSSGRPSRIPWKR